MSERPEPRWVSLAVARAIHADQVREHGGRHGLRDGALLESVLGNARTRARQIDADLPALAASLGHGLARDQPFLDANERTAFQLMYVFLGLNGWRIEARESEVERVILSLASAALPEPALAAWLRGHTVARGGATTLPAGPELGVIGPCAPSVRVRFSRCPEGPILGGRTRIGGVMERSLLIVDDDSAVVGVLRRFFLTHGWLVLEAAEGMEAAQIFTRERPDLVLLDLNLPGMSGVRVLEVIRARDPEATVILLAGHGEIATAVEAMRLGAENFLTKPVELAHVGAAAERAYEKVELRRRNRLLSARRPGVEAFDLGSSPMMVELGGQVELLADSDTPVLLLGEAGTGKGWVAGRIHSLSPRAAQPFVEINCAGLTASFLESELFGQERGAYADAREMKHGLFEIALGGTLFLDEVGDLALELQPKLLKVLESRRFRRLGGTRELQVDVRVVAATKHDLQQAVIEGRFREDLFQRLNMLPLRLPPLRERGREAIVELTGRIMADLRRQLGRGPSRIAPEALQALGGYGWPGNIRELRNVLERVLLLAADAPELRPEHLPPEVLGPDTGVYTLDGCLTLEDMERRHIAAVLRRERGRVAAAARTLGISRSTLYEKMHRYSLEPPRPVHAAD